MRGVVLSRANVILSECEGSLFTGDSSAFSLRMAQNIFSVDITPHPGLPQSGEGVNADLIVIFSFTLGKLGWGVNALRCP